MLQSFKGRAANFKNALRPCICPSLLIVTLSLNAPPSARAFQQPVDKIQQAVNSTKAAYYSEDADYHTDGQRTVWVKSYKKWVPQDLTVMKREAPHLLTFFNNAVTHNRLDVLEQLLPDYYRTHGGVQAFATDIKRALGQ